LITINSVNILSPIVWVSITIIAVDQGGEMEKSTAFREAYLNGNHHHSFSSSSASHRHVSYRFFLFLYIWILFIWGSFFGIEILCLWWGHFFFFCCWFKLADCPMLSVLYWKFTVFHSRSNWGRVGHLIYYAWLLHDRTQVSFQGS